MFEAAVAVDNCVYASSMDVNALFRIEICSGRTEYLRSFPQEEIVNKRLHYCAVQRNKQIVFFPFSGKYIQIYDTRNNKMCSLEVPDSKATFFSNAVADGDNVYLSSTRNQNIWKFSFSKNTIVKLRTGEKGCVYSLGSAFYEKYIYTLVYGSNILHRYSTIENRLEKVQINSNKKFSQILGIFNSILMLHEVDSGNILLIDLSTNNIQTEIKACATKIMATYQNGSYILGYSQAENLLVKISTINNAMEKLPLDDVVFNGAMLNDKNDIYYTIDNKYIYSLDSGKKICDLFFDELSIKRLREKVGSKLNLQEILYEGELVNLNMFLNNIAKV